MEKYREQQLDEYLDDEPGSGECYECQGDFPMGKLCPVVIKYQDGSKTEEEVCSVCYQHLRNEGKI